MYFEENYDYDERIRQRSHPEMNVINVELSTGLSGHEPNNKRRQTDKLRTRYLSNCNELRASRTCILIRSDRQ